MKTISLRIPAELLARVDAAADADDRSRNQVIVRALDRMFPARPEAYVIPDDARLARDLKEAMRATDASPGRIIPVGPVTPAPGSLLKGKGKKG